MDLDTTRNKKSYSQIITDFENHKVDILVGTQMVTKGLDFEKVSLVGILNADNMLNFPDFRAFERAYQLMAQVSGRAGRKNKRGKVVLQTNSPDHPVIHQVIRNDYEALFRSQCEERIQFKYPPFYRMIQIELKHKELDKVLMASKVFSTMLQQVFSQRVAGPVVPSVSRVQNMYIRYFVLKIEMEASPSKAKALLKELVNQLLSDVRFRTIRIQMDVDPN
jgi:primosomal protein N' (replication factor Y)